MSPVRSSAASPVLSLHACLALASLVMLLASGCGGQNAGAIEVEKPLSPVTGGTFRMLLEVPSSLDPSESSSLYDAVPVNQIFDGLVSMDAGMRVVPGLADSWTISRDGLTYIFFLRTGARFHDGSNVTAQDVAYTFERLLQPGVERRSQVFHYLQVVDGAEQYSLGESDRLPGVEADDAGTVLIKLARPCPTFLEVLTLDGLKIVPRKVLERVGQEAFRRSPVGTGPFKFKSWDDEGIRLEANTDYFAGRPYLDGVEILFAREGEDDFGTGRFMRRELDLLEPMSADLPVLSADPAVTIHRYQELSLSFMGFGTGIAPLDRVEIRQAIAHALDREAMVADSPVYRRTAVGIIPPGMGGYSPSSKVLPYDPQKARTLVAEAGYGPDNPVPPVRLLTGAGTSPLAKRLLERMRLDLRDAGIPLEVVSMDWPDLIGEIDDGTAPAFLLAWIADLSDPDDFLRGLLNSEGGDNCFNFSDEECRNLLARGSSELDPVLRARIYHQLERRILRQAPMVPLYHTLGVLAVNSKVHGFETSPMGLANSRLEKIWIEDGGV